MKRSDILLKKLNEFGITSFDKKWPDYIKELDLKKTDTKILTNNITSSNLSHITTGASVEQFGAMHAWRALGQLQAKESVKVLLNSLSNEKNQEAFWYRIELPLVIKLIGAEIIKPLTAFIKKKEYQWGDKVIIINGLVQIALNEPKFKDQIEEIINSVLKNYKKNDPAFNASILNALFKIKPYNNKLVREIINNDLFDYDFIDRPELDKFIKNAKMYQ
ncbi:hypothetical protein [Flavobacterium limi]|uniref:Uncharacterized protein n=1 Tax=Flavobacterium limi TaxID=2045105 RepID=A0ABQ1TTT3_9FLAO|nr:hypothetical protein [Flavobacterium limi]GGF03356.1 hypothetical protein GCM10011518_10600 [Flavobacterium limi]